MKKAVELRQLAASALDEWKNSMEARDKATTKEERTAKDTEVADKRNAYEQLAKQVSDAEAFEAAERQSAGNHARDLGRNPQESPEQKITKRFSVVRAIRMASSGKPLDGAEAEMYQEADKEARESGITLTGAVRVPGFVQATPERRDLTATGSSGAEGGYTIQTELGEMIPFLRPRLSLEGLGAQVLTGLSGNVDIPRQITGSSSAWEGENDTTSETNTTWDKLSLTPKRLAAFMDVSKRLMVQSSISVENFVRNDLNKAQRVGLETALINGATGGDNPVGILNTSGIGSVAIGTNGGAPTWAHIVKLWMEIAQDDADINTLAFLTTPGIAAQLMQTEKAASTAQFVWTTNNAMGSMNGYTAKATTLVPSTLTKGSSSDCHAIIFGDFSNLIIGNWGGLDLTVDPYTRAKDAVVVVTVNSYWNSVIRYPAGFAAIKDARVTI